MRIAPLTPTRRCGGARRPLPACARLPVARLLLTAGAAVAGVTACGGGAATPTTAPRSSTARPSPAQTTRFVSKRYGYAIRLPGSSSDWTASYALVGWVADAVQPNSPAFDTFTSLKDARLYVVAARRPPTGPTLAKWTAYVTSVICARPESVATSTLSGAPARVLSWSCPDLNAIGATAVHGRRGYFLLVASPKSSSSASNRSAFDAARASFTFLGG